MKRVLRIMFKLDCHWSCLMFIGLSLVQDGDTITVLAKEANSGEGSINIEEELGELCVCICLCVIRIR